MSSPTDTGARRLPPEARRRQLLDAARACMDRDGLAGFTLEAVAREAGVTGPLLRHYFGTREGMLIALVEQGLEQLRGIFLGPGSRTTLPERLDAYLDFTAAAPWGHALWMHAGEIHPDLGRLVAETRHGLAAASGFGADWESMPRDRQLAAIGWIGFVEALIAEWVAGGFADRDAVFVVLADAARRFGVGDHGADATAPAGAG